MSVRGYGMLPYPLTDIARPAPAALPGAAAGRVRAQPAIR